MELFLYLIFLDLDKMDIYRDKRVFYTCSLGFWAKWPRKRGSWVELF